MSMVFANRISIHTSDGAAVTGGGEILGVIVTAASGSLRTAIFHDSTTNDNEIFQLKTGKTDLGDMTIVRDIPFKVNTGLFVEVDTAQTVSVFIRRGAA